MKGEIQSATAQDQGISSGPSWGDSLAFLLIGFGLGWGLAEARSRRIVDDALRQWLGSGEGGDAGTQAPSLSELVRKVDQVGRLANTDELTGLLNRQRTLDELGSAAARARVQASWLALCMVDLDNFKRVNDTFGHEAGDTVLLAVAERLSDELQEGELLGRVGGEEFLMIMPRLDLGDAERRAEELRQAVAGNPVILADGNALPITASFGVVATYGLRCRVEAMRSAADQALYRAKHEGRNAVRSAAVDQ